MPKGDRLRREAAQLQEDMARDYLKEIEGLRGVIRRRNMQLEDLQDEYDDLDDALALAECRHGATSDASLAVVVLGMLAVVMWGAYCQGVCVCDCASLNT